MRTRYNPNPGFSLQGKEQMCTYQSICYWSVHAVFLLPYIPVRLEMLMTPSGRNGPSSTSNPRVCNAAAVDLLFIFSGKKRTAHP
ncbi:hypothetical protein EYF80_022832 [Liparis tanakae]|uniref:Uncharacterized protein n=1 Tax=Liparis tanakae TaxID=230148 RepID=A0A4Z2HNS8_9TELE|nr:hypothetical protein EYF80_022832 [Liparis tanakae]